MQGFARTRLAMVGLSLATPLAARAGEIPSYANGGFKTPQAMASPGAPASKVAAVGVDGKVVVANVPPGTPVVPPARVMTEAEARSMAPPPRIVACAHSSHGVCQTCQAVLDMPGTVTMMPQGAPAAAPAPAHAHAHVHTNAPAMVAAEPPGRAVASSPGHPQANEDGPMPIGVTQANFQQGGPVGMPAGAPAMARPGAPGHALAASGPGMGSAPYQAPKKELRPRIFGHLFGWSYIGKDWREAREREVGQAHASIRYGEENKAVNELPASMVYGPR